MPEFRTGVDLIAAERERQAKLWGDEHDDGHSTGELACAASVYALPPRDRDDYGDYGNPGDWPWKDGYKPTPDDRVGELVKAGALIVAEIERLQRLGS